MTGRHQSISRPLTSYENVLADELEGIFGRGVHDLDGVVKALNESGVRPPDGSDWTAESFKAEMNRLGSPQEHPGDPHELTGEPE